MGGWLIDEPGAELGLPGTAFKAVLLLQLFLHQSRPDFLCAEGEKDLLFVGVVVGGEDAEDAYFHFFAPLELRLNKPLQGLVGDQKLKHAVFPHVVEVREGVLPIQGLAHL